MKRLSYALAVGSLALAFAVRGEETSGSEPPPPPDSPGLSTGAPPPLPAVSAPGRDGRSRRGSRGQGWGGFRSRFREELETMRGEIQRTRALIAELEERVASAPTDDARLELRRRLDETRRHSAELQLTLAQKKVEITRQALEFSQKRYDDARLELRKTMNKLRSQYPDLVGAPATPPAD